MIDSRSNLEQQAADEFHKMVGYCIAEWALVDDELFRIFQACLGVSSEQCAILYYRVPGLDMRLGLVDEIVRSILPKKPKRSGVHEHEAVKMWDGICKDLKNFLSIRRRIAHQPVRAQFEMKPCLPHPRHLYFDPQDSHTLQASFEIYVSQNEQRCGKNDGPLPLTITKLQSHLKDVEKLHSSMSTYFHDILKPALTPPQKATQQATETY